MNATITITLPAELAQTVSAKAMANGKGLEEYTLDVLRKDSELPMLRELFADVREQIKASGASDEELVQEIDAAVAEVRTRRRA